MIDPQAIHGLDATAYSAIGALAVAVRWLWSRLKKCEERHDRIDREAAARAKRPQKRARK